MKSDYTSGEVILWESGEYSDRQVECVTRVEKDFFVVDVLKQWANEQGISDLLTEGNDTIYSYSTEQQKKYVYFSVDVWDTDSYFREAEEHELENEKRWQDTTKFIPWLLITGYVSEIDYHHAHVGCYGDFSVSITDN